MVNFKQELDTLNAYTRNEREEMVDDAREGFIEKYFKKHPVNLDILIKILQVAALITKVRPVLNMSIQGLLLLCTAFRDQMRLSV